ncbi:MAG: hypothetical protein ACK40S_09885 [Burkholderiaceae bacterium]
MKALLAALMAGLFAVGASAQVTTPHRAHAPKVVKAKSSHSLGAKAVSSHKVSAQAGKKTTKSKKSKKRTARKA